MITKRLLYDAENDELVLMSVYSTDNNAIWIFETDGDCEAYTYDYMAAFATICELEEVGDL